MVQSMMQNLQMMHNTCTKITPPATIIEAVGADVVASEMVVDVAEDVLKVVAAVIVTRMVTAPIWEQIAEHQEKITIPLLPSTTCWVEGQHIDFGSHQNDNIGQI